MRKPSFSFAPGNRELSRSLNLIIFSIAFGQMFFSIFGAPVGSPFFTGFLRKLGAGDLVYAICSALPVVGAVTQVLGAWFVETTGRRKLLFLASGLTHRLLWMPVALLPVLTGESWRTACIWLCTVLITVSSVASSICGIAFNSWMGSLIPTDIRGRFFGLRSLISTATGTAAGIGVGIFIDHVSTLWGFAVVFLIGSVFGAVDIATFFIVRHPPMTPPERRPRLLPLLIEPLRNRRYMGYVAFATVFTFGVQFPAPFFNVYMIEQLKMDYFHISLTSYVCMGLATIFTVRRWGVLADRHGNRPVVLCGAAVIAFVPLLWIFSSPQHTIMAYLVYVIAGVAGAGFNLANFNLMVWLAPEKNRSSYMAVYTVFTSVLGGGLPYICGGLFMQYLSAPIASLQIAWFLGGTVNSYQALFFVSAVLRALAILFLFRFVKEDGAAPASLMARSEMALLRERMPRRPLRRH